MSKLTSPIGKPLKGLSSASAAGADEISTAVINAISSGSVTLGNVDISGGIISNVTIGQDGAGPLYTTTIIAGSPTGIGYDIIFYGDTIGEYAEWNSTLGIWSVFGDTYTSGISDMGNIRITGNTISSTNVDGSIILDPNGSGCLIINSCIQQTSTIGDVSFNITDGSFSSTSTGIVSLESLDDSFSAISSQKSIITSKDGDVLITSGSSKSTSTISHISLGVSPIITSSSPHRLEIGDSITISSTDTVPIITGVYDILSTPTDTTFTIDSSSFPITTEGTSGTFVKITDIYLNSSDNINIPYDVKLTFGSDSNYISDTNEDFNIATAGDINLIPELDGDINLPDNIGLTFGSDLRKIESDGNDISINGDNSIVLNSVDLIVNSTNVSFTDPIIKLDSGVPVTNNNQDKGIEFNYYDTSSKLGWFGYDNSTDSFSFFTDATNTGEVVSGTLGSATFASSTFGSIDTCNISCSGTMTISAVSGILLSTPKTIVPQGSILQFGESGSPVTSIFKEPTGEDLIIQSQCHVFITPGGTDCDVIIPTQSAIVLNGEGGSQKIESISTTELSISSSSFLNLNQISGGVRLTEGLPLLFNQNETSKITGDLSGNLLINSENSINLLPSGGNVTLPVSKKIEFGNPTTYIGSDSLNNFIANTNGSLSVTSVNSQSFTSTNSDIFITPLNSVILPKNKSLQLGDSTEFLKSDNSNNIVLSSSGYSDIISGDSINLSPTTYVNIPYTKPLQFGSSLESISGGPGNLYITSANTNVSGNLTVEMSVHLKDPIITIGEGLVDDNKDRGIEFNYNDVTQKLGYFGMDDTDKTFMYIPIATNTDEVISGDLGNVKFAGASLTSLNMNDGTISSVNVLSSENNITIDPGLGQDVVFNNDSGSNIIIPTMVDLVFGNETNKIYSDGTDLHIVDNLSVDGDTTVNGDLLVTGNISIIGGATVNLTVQRFSISGGGSASPNAISNATLITTLSPGIASGTLPAALVDGFLKTINVVSLFAGSTYELLFPTGRLLDPGTGTTVAKKMIFDCPGQGVQLLWDNVSQFYIIANGGGELVLA